MPPGFKPVGFKNTSGEVIQGSGVPDSDFGLPGGGGRMFAFL